MKIKKLLCIGTSCNAMFFADIFNLRYKGPVDNIGCEGTIHMKSLFNGEFRQNIINQEYCFISSNVYNVDKYDVCQFDCGFLMFHNDFHLEKTKNEILKRYDNFYKYIEDAKIDKELFFVYSYHIYDFDNLSSKQANDYWNILPKHIKDRLILINCYDNYPIFDKDYPIFNIKENILRNDKEYVKKEFYLWWNTNKKFYEQKNNINYERYN